MDEAGSSDNGVCGDEAPLTDPTVCEEQTPLQSRSVNPPPPSGHPNTPSRTGIRQPTPSQLPFGQQEEQLQPTLFEELVALSSLPPNPFTLQSAPTAEQDTATSAIVAGSSVLPMYPSELVALHQAIRYIVLVPRTQVPLHDSTVCDEETHQLNSNTDLPPPMNRPQTSSTSTTCQPNPSELPFGQQDELPVSLLTTHPSLPPNPLTSRPPPAATLCTAPSVTVAVGTLLPVDPLEVAALECATRHLVLPPRTHAELYPIEEVAHNHSSSELVSGRGLPVPMGLAVVCANGLDRTAVEDSVIREECC